MRLHLQNQASPIRRLGDRKAPTILRIEKKLSIPNKIYFNAYVYMNVFFLRIASSFLKFNYNPNKSTILIINESNEINYNPTVKFFWS